MAKILIRSIPHPLQPTHLRGVRLHHSLTRFDAPAAVAKVAESAEARHQPRAWRKRLSLHWSFPELCHRYERKLGILMLPQCCPTSTRRGRTQASLSIPALSCHLVWHRLGGCCSCLGPFGPCARMKDWKSCEVAPAYKQPLAAEGLLVNRHRANQTCLHRPAG